jgi:hypothetical protein
MDLIKSGTDLIKSKADLIKSVTDLVNWMMVGVKSGTDLIKSKLDLIKSAMDRVKSLMDLIKSVTVGVKSEADLIKSATDLTQRGTDLTPKTRFSTPKPPAKNRFNPPPTAHLAVLRRVAQKTVISGHDSSCRGNLQVLLSGLWHVTANVIRVPSVRKSRGGITANVAWQWFHVMI